MDDKKVIDFLFERKTKLLNMERIAKGKALSAITSQVQVIEAFLWYITTNQNEENMEELKLSLDDQLIPLEELKPRQRENRIADAIIKFVEKIPPGYSKPINQPGVSVRTVLTQVYALKEKGLLPPEIMAISRNGGKQGYIGRAKSAEDAERQQKEAEEDGDGESKKEVSNQKTKGK